MSPCDPNDLSINVPPGPSGPSIPGFGFPFIPGLGDPRDLLPNGFPEDLLQILDLLQFILPSGIIKPALNPNFGKDIFDGIMKLLDQFFPFLMLYKFFLPILDLIICIIEVLCAIANPFKLIRKLKRLFRSCLPAFLSLFPIFALIVMLLSLLFLILALIEYIILKIIELIEMLLANILGLVEAFTIGNEAGIFAIIKKLSGILCAFQNLFVIFAIFKTIIDVIKEILKLFFAIPPCDDGDNGDAEKCCSAEVCPAFIRNNETLHSVTGTLQYYNRVARDAGLNSLLPGLPSGFLTSNTREESWQFFDADATLANAFYNITHAIDLPEGFDTVFFPTDANYTATTPTNQVPYTLDMRLFYNPTSFGRLDPLGPRFIQIKDCIILKAPTQSLNIFNNSSTLIANGVFQIQGGVALENDAVTPLIINGVPATLNSFIHLNDEVSTAEIPLLPTDGYQFDNVEYTFHIHHEILLGKNLITLGCIPTVALDRTVINTVFGGNAGPNFSLLNSLINNANFPDPGAAQECMATALTALRSNISAEGVATFQATCLACMSKLRDDTTNAISSLLGIGFDQYKSTFTITPNVQFTTQPINVQVLLNETNGQPLTLGMPATLSDSIGQRIKPTATFGSVGAFAHDGTKFFNANLTSASAGIGSIKMSFDGKVFSTITLPTDVTIPPTIEEIVLPYTFIYSPSSANAPTSDGDTDGKPQFDAGDAAIDSKE